ncbi:FxsA family protein [Paracoccaceae bacterium]|nr:FxsA family protein [Paracoccaceae bacterium]
MWLFFIFISIPLIEIILFIQLGSLIGLWLTLLTVLITAIIGTIMVRAQGLAAVSRLQSSFSRLENPSEPLANGAMILISGALLLTPGFLTDAIGFAFLIPAVRLNVYRYMRNKFSVQQFHMATRSHPSSTDHSPYQRSEAHDILNGDYEDVTPKAPETKPSGWTKH